MDIEKDLSGTVEISDVLSVVAGNHWAKDLNGVYVWINDEFLETYGVSSKDQVIGKTDFDLSWRESASKLVKNDELVINTCKKHRYIEETMLPSGEKIFLATTKNILRDKNGKVCGTVGNSINITELKNTQKKLEEALEQAGVAAKAKDCIVENMRHDWITPFCGVYSLPDILATQETDPEKKEMLVMAAEAGESMMLHVKSILEMVGAADGLPKVTSQQIEIKNFIEDIYKMYLPICHNKKISLKLDINQSGLPEIILSDPYRLKRILINLLSNAVKFTDEGGAVEFDFELSEAKIRKESFMKIVIKDSGIGMSNLQVEQMYEPFYRVSPAYDAKYAGSGNGLTTVRRYLEDLNGEISCKSDIGKGTNFSLAIPCTVSLLA